MAGKELPTLGLYTFMGNFHPSHHGLEAWRVHSALCRETDLGYTEGKDLGDRYHKRGND